MFGGLNAGAMSFVVQGLHMGAHAGVITDT